jgi:hypothetical protein
VAGATVAKVFLWPLLVLFSAGGRWRAGLVSIVVAALAVLASWAVIGFAGLTDYPHLLSELSKVESPRGYSPTALGLALGLPRGAALALAIAAGLPLLVGAAALIRRPGSELPALACAIAAVVALSPVVWLHYLVLLIVPIAAARDRLGPLWFAPLLFWITPGTASNGSAWRIALVLAIVAATLALAARKPESRRNQRAGRLA